MTNTSSSAPAVAAKHPAIAMNLQLQRLSAEMWAWVSGHILQIAIGTGVAALIVVVLLGMKMLGLRICRSDPSHNSWRTTIGRVLARTKLWFMLAVAARLVASYADAPQVVAMTINFFFVVTSALQVAIWARELVLGIIEHRAGNADEHAALGSAIGIIRLLVSIAIFAVAIIVILDNLGVNVTGLIAGLGIGGIAIGLAAQGIFADLFAALSIIFDKPFRRGDSIKWDTTSGTVEQIGLKTTRVRAITGEEVVISNANLLGKELHNMARLNRRRIVQPFGVIYQTPPEICAKIPDIVRDIVEGHNNCTLVRCGMIGLGASSLDYELQFDVNSADYDEVFAARSIVLINVLKAFNDAGIEFAYPTQTSFTAAPDGTLIMPYPAPPDSKADVVERK
jgi:small-conductance mechanosensitive channel